MNRVEILNTAAELISGDRAATYGDATVSHQRIADLWSTYLSTPISAVDVAMCMVLLKVSRSKGGDKPGKMDTFVDIAGYAALCAEFEAATTPVKEVHNYRLKDLRVSKGFSQQDFAKAMGMTQGAVSHLETNRMKLNAKMLNKMCSIFGLSEDTILDILNSTATTAIKEANGSHVGLNSATLAATMRFDLDEG